jgi:hypothetical protein
VRLRGQGVGNKNKNKAEQMSILKKIANAISKTWTYLDGKKRRIATVSGIVMTIAKPHTVAYAVAQYAVYIFGGADIAATSTKAIKNKLPGGLSDAN